jgi:hypothetical protein
MTAWASSLFVSAGVVAWVVVRIVGCADVDSTGGSGDSDTTQLVLSIGEGLGKLPLVGLPPLEGVALCETDTPNCTTTDASGTATLELPANESVSWTLEREGYASQLTPAVTDGAFDPSQHWQMVTDEWMADLHERLMSTYPLTDRAMVWFFTVPPFPGVTFDLIDATGKQVYADEGGIFHLDREATTSFGQGGFLEVVSGEFEVEVGGTAERCGPFAAWPGSTSNRFTIPARAGYVTVAGFQCPLPRASP